MLRPCVEVAERSFLATVLYLKKFKYCALKIKDSACQKAQLNASLCDGHAQKKRLPQSLKQEGERER